MKNEDQDLLESLKEINASLSKSLSKSRKLRLVKISPSAIVNKYSLNDGNNIFNSSW